jgi:hypothetical protein
MKLKKMQNFLLFLTILLFLIFITSDNKALGRYVFFSFFTLFLVTGIRGYQEKEIGDDWGGKIKGKSAQIYSVIIIVVSCVLVLMEILKIMSLI